jgi:hypothetical protein
MLSAGLTGRDAAVGFESTARGRLERLLAGRAKRLGIIAPYFSHFRCKRGIAY